MLQEQQVLQGRYQLQDCLGKNAGRQTWLAEDQSTSPPELVIVKLLAFSPQLQWDELKLFEREAQTLRTLDHPRIPKYRDYFSIDQDLGAGLCWFVLVQDYIPGVSLQKRLDQGQHFTETQVRAIATQVLEILHYLHGLHPPVLHRDIKPSNLIWGTDEAIYLVDFGAVQDPTAVEGVTFTVVGTAGYAPLEQFWGKAVPASDLYALGATLIHLLTGTAPADLPQKDLRIQFQDRVSLDSTLIDWIDELTAPDLEQRFSSAAEALEALETGRSRNFSRTIPCQPAKSRIQLKKSPTRLVVKLPPRLSLINLVKLSVKFVLALGSLIFLMPPILIETTAALMILLAVIFGTVNPAVVVLLVPVLAFLIWSLREAQRELARLQDDFRAKLIASFGTQYLHFFRTESMQPPAFSFSDRPQQFGKPAALKSIEAIPFEEVIVEVSHKRYRFGRNLTELEREWLVQEIQAWLHEPLSHSPSQGQIVKGRG